MFNTVVSQEFIILSYPKPATRRGMLLTVLLGVFSVLLSASAGAGERTEDWYRSTEDPMAVVEQVLSDARAGGTYALFVLGANWCHDSRALAERMQQSPLAELLQTQYKTALIDVGYYQFGFDVMKAFGEPIYYATPTVLIVDPATRSLVNAHNRHQWGNAFNISMDESIDYFSRMAGASPAAERPSLFPRHVEQIDAWEAQAAERVAAAYAAFGPLLEAFDSGNKMAVPDFRSQFRAFSRSRMAVPEGLASLQNQARDAAEAGTSNTELELPALPEFRIAEADF